LLVYALVCQCREHGLIHALMIRKGKLVTPRQYAEMNAYDRRPDKAGKLKKGAAK